MNSVARRLLVIAGVSLALATALGAFGTHALESRLPLERMRSYETAVSYQFFHSLGLLGIALLLRDSAQRGLVIAAWMLAVGMLLFSGSIYALTFGAPRWVVALAPVGGASLMAEWVVFAIAMANRAR
jgi:uncharacterized membrane protein YgdD (TMEM256/DUF423 family)